MSSSKLPRLLLQSRYPVLVASVRYQRTPFGPPKRTFEDRNRMFLDQHKKSKLALSEPIPSKPEQWKRPQLTRDPKVVSKERKLLPLKEEQSPYQAYTPEKIKSFQDLGTYYDPLFNPHLHEGRNLVNPEEEPFNAIYADSVSEASNSYTKVRNITSPELWKYVERLERIKVAPVPELRKSDDPVTAMPSGFVPPREAPPDLPYFVRRTRNYLLPVYYMLNEDPEKSYTSISKVSGDLWKLEEDLRTHLESLNSSRRRILTSVYEPEGKILFRGKHLHQVVDWLHEQGF